MTYPYLIGIDESKAQVKRLTREAKAAILEAQLDAPDKLLLIADYLVQRDY